MILLAFDHHNSGTVLAWEALKAGRPALDALELGVRAVEANPDEHSVGLSGYPNALGEVELDAAVMDGRTRGVGAVGGLRGFVHPVSVARAVMARLPHVMLIGEGAARFAEEIGAERADLLTDSTRDAWQAWCVSVDLDPTALDARTPLIDVVRATADPVRTDEESARAKGTTVYLGQDANGDIAAVTSTSGWAWKYPGRVGDTPIAGAGLYADNRYGAAACTGMGELAIRTGTAHATVLYMKMGMSVREAVRTALDDVLSLPGPVGGLSLYAIDAAGGYHAAATPRRGDSAYFVATAEMVAPARWEAECRGDEHDAP